MQGFLSKPHVEAVSGGGGNRTRDACHGNPRNQAVSLALLLAGELALLGWLRLVVPMVAG